MFTLSPPTPLSFLLFLFARSTMTLAAETKITVDDRSPMVTYNGNGWDNNYRSGLNLEGFHATSEDRGASAVFEFTGTAVEYLAPLWPYRVTSAVQLDSFAKVTINLQDPNATPTTGGSESALFGVRWSQTGLANTTHKLVVSMADGADNGGYIVVDGFTYTQSTIDDPNSSTSSPSSTSSAASNTNTASSSSSSKNNTLPIALGAALGSSALVAAFILAFICFKRRRRTRVRTEFDAPPIVPFTPTPTPGGPPMAQMGMAGTPNSGDAARYSQYYNAVSRTSDGAEHDLYRNSMATSAYTAGAAGVGAYQPQAPFPGRQYSTHTNSEYNPAQSEAGYASEQGYGTATNSYPSASSQAGLIAHANSISGSQTPGGGGSSSRPLALVNGNGEAHVADEKAFIRNQKEIMARQDRVDEEPVVAPPAYEM